MTDLKTAIANAMAARRRELIARPLANVWGELSQAAMDATKEWEWDRYNDKLVATVAHNASLGSGPGSVMLPAFPAHIVALFDDVHPVDGLDKAPISLRDGTTTIVSRLTDEQWESLHESDGTFTIADPEGMK